MKNEELQKERMEKLLLEAGTCKYLHHLDGSNTVYMHMYMHCKKKKNAQYIKAKNKESKKIKKRIKTGK